MEPRPKTIPSVYDSLPIGVCVIDREFRVREWNECLVTWSGVARDTILGKRVADFFPEFDEGRLTSRLKTVFGDDGQPLVLSASLHHRFLPIRTHDGGWMPQRTYVRRLPSDGEPLAIVSIEDLSQPFAQLEALRRERRRLGESEASLQRQRAELEQANAKLGDARDRAEHANRSKSEFLANMSHEIRTPLTAILGYADILLDNPSRETLRDAAGTIHRNGDHLLAIVNDILDLSKIEAGRMPIDQDACDPLSIAREVLSLIRVRADEKRLALTLDCKAEPPLIRSDAIRIRQMLLNLVGNAVKFTQHGSVTLVMDWNEQTSKIRFDVIDTGIGIGEDQLEAIFQPFNQADTSARRRFGGTGLGLTICRRLAEMLGGKIDARSKPGLGSTFSLTLPVVPAESDPARPAGRNAATTPAPVKLAEGPPLLGKRILIAEDGIDNQRLLRHVLEKAGAAVTIVGDGKQAVRNLVGSDAPGYHVVLMDMQMPVMDGYQATRTLRDRGYTGPVIALTAHAMDGDRQKTLDAGCDDYASKPFKPLDLIELIGRYAHGNNKAITPTLAATAPTSSPATAL